MDTQTPLPRSDASHLREVMEQIGCLVFRSELVSETVVLVTPVLDVINNVGGGGGVDRDASVRAGKFIRVMAEMYGVGIKGYSSNHYDGVLIRESIVVILMTLPKDQQLDVLNQIVLNLYLVST